MKMFDEYSIWMTGKTSGAAVLATTVIYCSFVVMPAYAASNNPVVEWDRAALQGIRDSKLGAPMAARALAIVDTQLGGALRRPLVEHTLANKEQAISYAAYRALFDVLPVDIAGVYAPLMKQLGYDPQNTSTDIETPAGIGNVACAAVLEFRHHDNANQLGDLAQGAYSDWSAYSPRNKPSVLPMRQDTVVDPNRWQPLVYVNSTGDLVGQRFLAAQWCFVTPFALTKGDELRAALKPFEPAVYGSPEYREQAEELVNLSAGLTDEQKSIAEYWLDGPNSEQPPGHWMRFAQWVSERDHHSLDDDVKMFFLLSNALFDSGIAAWDAKRSYDSVRPVTAISVLFKGQQIQSWGGPGKGTVDMDGSQWIPYQPTTFPTPPFPDFVSGHSTYSAAAAAILVSWTGSDHFGYSMAIPAGSSKVEPGVTPAHDLVPKWETFTDAANEAGMSRRYGGIHFARADLGGRMLRRLVAAEVWTKGQSYFDGTAKPINFEQPSTSEVMAAAQMSPTVKP